MIYTVTLNPCIDYILYMDKLSSGTINRSKEEKMLCGGKGINVSKMLKELDTKSVATGFVAGFTGAQIIKDLKNDNIDTDFVTLENGNSRINVKIRENDETDINATGPTVYDYDLHLLYKKLSQLNENDMLIISGSAPKGVDDDVYAKIVEKATKNGVRCVVDCTGQMLKNTLSHKPFLIKPNLSELEELFNVKLQCLSEVEKYAIKLQHMGAKNVLVSMGDKGAILLSEKKKAIVQKAIKGELIDSVGAGDSMVAGFVAGYLKTGDYKYALQLGTACGSATAFCYGLAKRDDVEKALEIIKDHEDKNTISLK